MSLIQQGIKEEKREEKVEERWISGLKRKGILKSYGLRARLFFAISKAENK